MNKKIVILSGPSCVGKGPLRAALRQYHPEIAFAEPINCHSRRPRLKKASGNLETHGIDYYFLPRAMFYQLDPQRFLTIEIRSEYQAVDLAQIENLLTQNNIILIEAYPSAAFKLKQWALEKWTTEKVKVVMVFLSPVPMEEATSEHKIYELMYAKLIRRGEDAPEKIAERARSAFQEIQHAHLYYHIIFNPIGEDDITGWGDPLSADAKNTLEQFIKILKND